MTVISRTAGVLLGATVSALIALPVANPVANADPKQCGTTFGQSASEQVQGYLDRHPDVKAALPENPADLDRVFGTPEEVGCKMG